MSETSGEEVFLSRAKGQEKEYDWLGVAESCKKALTLVSERDFFKMGEIHERLGYAFHRASMQAESTNEFRDRMGQAVANYNKAKEFYEKFNEPRKAPRILRCDAMIAYVGFWLASEAPEKKRLIDESWRLTKESLRAFKQVRDAWEYERTYNQLSSSAIFGFTFESDFQARENAMREAAECGEQAVTFLSALEDPYELARAGAKTALCLGVLGCYFVDPDGKERLYQKGVGYWQKANELSEEATLLEFLHPVFGGQMFLGLEGTDEALANFEKALGYAKKAKDSLLVGCALDWLAYHTAWKTWPTEDPDKKTEFLEKALRYSEDARREFSKVSFSSPRGDYFWSEAPCPDYYFWSASIETNPSKKRELLEKCLDNMPEMMRRAEISGYPEIMLCAHGTFSAVLLYLAKVEMNPEKKERLLELAVEHGSESSRITEQLEPFLYWNRGMMQMNLADAKSELADLAKDPETKKSMLQEAVIQKEKALELSSKDLAFSKSEGKISMFAVLGYHQSGYGKMRNRLYELTNNIEHAEKAIEAFIEAAESYRKLDLIGWMAESYWKIGQIYDNVNEHVKSAENFDLASSNYRQAAEKIPELKDLYMNHALYMQAWTEIEKARHHHRRQEFGMAREHFAKAADLHLPLKKWSYLASNYAAWAQVEHAEELSRNEQSEEAIQAFEQAVNLFSETKKSLQMQLSKIVSPEEKQMATSLAKATDQRREYCLARIILEKARILDKKGEHYFSSEKYGSAAEAFEKISQALESEQDKEEFKFIISLSRAWQKMTRAEAEASPELYAEASQLFEEAKEFGPNEKAKMLALGHSRFCKTLEAGTKYADTRDMAMHATALRHLESAANYYLKAGLQNASEYAKATGLLLEAYANMDKAGEERDPEKKAKLYMMVEKVLQTSAGSFMKAEHPEKREQVMRLLETVREERELAISLTEVLHAPSVVSTTAAIQTPTPTNEEAVGLEKFESADVQANLILSQKELKVGEHINLEIELINAGRGPALLTKIMEVIPEGFELTEKPENYRAEDSYLNMKGKRLDPLKTEEVKLVLRSRAQGVFPLKPRILYLDENGKYKSHEPEPIILTVKELGIKGWLKG